MTGAVSASLAAPTAARQGPTAAPPSASLAASASGAVASAAPVGAALAAEPSSISERATVLLVVDDAPAAQRAIEAAAAALGGRVVRASDVEIVVEVPRAARRDLWRAVRALGEARAGTVVIEDVAWAVSDAEAGLRADDERARRLDGIAARGGGVAPGLVVERAREHAAIERAEQAAALRELERRAAFAELTVTLAVKRHAGLPDDGEVRLPFPWLQRLGLGALSDLESRRERGPVLRGFFQIDTGFAIEAPLPDSRLDRDVTTLSVGTALRALSEANPVGVFGGYDLWLGGGLGGFAYDVQTLLGIGVPFGSGFAIGVASGPGLEGLTGVIPLGLTVPIEADVDIEAARGFGLRFWARDGWVIRDARRRGAPHAPFGDEAGAGLDVVLGERGEGAYTRRRQGFTVGLAARETLGTQLYELRLGWRYFESDLSAE